MYAIIYTRRGSAQHDRLVDAYIDAARYVVLSGALYRIVDVDWFHASAERVRWQVRHAAHYGEG